MRFCRDLPGTQNFHFASHFASRHILQELQNYAQHTFTDIKIKMKEASIRNNSSNSQQQVPIWIFLSLSILFTGLTSLAIMSVSSSSEHDFNLYSTTEFIVKESVTHNRRRLRSNKNKLRRRRIPGETNHMRPFILKDHRTDAQHLQEILYFLNHL